MHKIVTRSANQVLVHKGRGKRCKTILCMMFENVSPTFQIKYMYILDMKKDSLHIIIILYTFNAATNHVY